MPVLGCDSPVGCVVGAEKLADGAGVWLKTRIVQRGHFLVAITRVVAAGQPRVFEMRVDLRPLVKVAAAIHRKLHAQQADLVSGLPPEIGAGFFKKLVRRVKKTAKRIGKSKLLRRVGKLGKSVVRVSKSVIKSKITGAIGGILTVFPPTAAAGAALTAGYVAANAAVRAIEKGAKVAKTAASIKREIEGGVRVARRAKRALTTGRKSVRKLGRRFRLSASAKRKIAARASKMSPRRRRRFGLSLQQKVMAKARGAVQSRLSKAARRKIAARAKRMSPRQRRALAAALRKKLSRSARRRTTSATARRRRVRLTAAARRKVVRAVTLKRKLRSPAVRSRLRKIVRQSETSKKMLREIATKARYGRGATQLTAAKSAAVINLVAQNRARIRAAAQQNAGGLPAILIDRRGRLTPGRFRIQASPPPSGRADVLYLGPNRELQSGQFARVGCDGRPCDDC